MAPKVRAGISDQYRCPDIFKVFVWKEFDIMHYFTSRNLQRSCYKLNMGSNSCYSWNNYCYCNIRIVWFRRLSQWSYRQNDGSLLRIIPNSSTTLNSNVHLTQKWGLSMKPPGRPSDTYAVDVLCCQPIKLFQVVSTSEFHEY